MSQPQEAELQKELIISKCSFLMFYNIFILSQVEEIRPKYSKLNYVFLAKVSRTAHVVVMFAS